jgi:hypothetical protein
MRAIPCPIHSLELEQLYTVEKLTDEEIADRLGNGATPKRVRSWRKRFGIETIHRWMRHDVLPLEGRLRSLLVGSMLGDGRLVRRTHASYFTEGHSAAQRPYLDWKIRQWGAWVQSDPFMVEKKENGNLYTMWRFNTVAHDSLNDWQALFYEQQDKGWKRLLPAIVEHVDALSLAVWFLDDGYAGWWPDITFGADAKSREVAFSIFEKFGLRPRWELKKINGTHETGMFHMEREDTAEKFLSLITPHVPSCMNYKMKFGYDSGRNNIIKGNLTKDVLSDLATKGVPIRKMAEMLGVGGATIDRHLRKHGIEHHRTKGNPLHRS